MNTPVLTPTLEDYLEAIYQISSFNRVARSMEIADKLQVKRSSVTVALRSLAEKGLINYQARSYVTLTDNGLSAARCVAGKHHILSDFFVSLLGMTDQEADHAACGMEHGMTSEVCKKMAALVNTLKNDKKLATTVSESINNLQQKFDCIQSCNSGLNKKMMPAIEGEKTELYDLNSLKPGERGIIEKIAGSGTLRKRLREMGVTHGQEILLVRSAPLDDPIEVQIRNFHMSLRREEAAFIVVHKL